MVIACHSARAQSFSACPGLPLEKAVVDSDPVFQNICTEPPPCSRASAPVVLTDPADDFVRAQGLVLEATVPDGFVADMIRWRTEYLTANGAPMPLWDYETTEGIKKDAMGDPLPGPYTVRFGAPGLRENTSHRFRVSFRRDSDDFWLCLSARSDPEATTPFSTFGPTAPVTTEVEDEFRRPETDYKFQGGAGLGPTAVWNENQGQDSARILSDGQSTGEQFSAFLEPTALARYVTEAADPRTYTEGLFRRDQPGTYNLEVVAKYHEVSSSPMAMNYYFLKLALGFRGCNTNPTMFLVRAVEEGPVTTCDGDTPPHPPNPALPADATLVIPEASQPKCGVVPPFDQEDTSDTFTPKRSLPVWLRIEVDRNAAGEAVIHGTVAWNCPDNQPIGNCANVCTKTRIDKVSPDMVNVEGQWGFFVHDKNYFLDFFRAGSDPFE